MKTRFINCLYFSTFLSFFPGFVSFGQQHEKHEDIVFSNSQVTGVGTPTITYHLIHKLDPQVGVELKNYLTAMNAIVDVQVKDLEVIIQFKENTTHEMIYLFIQRMEMLYIYRNTKTN